MKSLLLFKAHVRAHDRTTQSGGKAWVRAHEDSRKNAVEEIGGNWYGAQGKADIANVAPAQTHTFPGGFMTNPDTNETYWVKQGLDDDQTRVEHLSNRLYRKLGIKVAPTRLVTHGGQLRVASRVAEGAQKVNPASLPGHPDVHKGFVADAWLGAYDVAGMDHSNLLRDKDGGVVRIDQGGSLHRRAQGKVKGPDQWGPEVKEMTSMLDPKINSKTAAMFSKMTPAEILEGIKGVASLSDADIDREVEQAGLGPKTAEMLKWRRENLRHKGRTVERAMKSEAEGGKLPEPIKPMETDSPVGGEKSPIAPKAPGFIEAMQQPDGGFTVHPMSGDVPTTGFVVSPFPEHSVELPNAAAVTEQSLYDYLKKNKAVFLADPKRHFGGWHDPDGGKIWLDVVVVTQSEDEAIAIGKANNQKSYFNIATHTVVDLGGTGAKTQTTPGGSDVGGEPNQDVRDPLGQEDHPGGAPEVRGAGGGNAGGGGETGGGQEGKVKNWWSQQVTKHGKLKIGSTGTVRWTNSHHFFKGKAEVVKMSGYPNGKTMHVRLLEDVAWPGSSGDFQGYKKGHILILPTVINLKGFTVNNHFDLDEG